MNTNWLCSLPRLQWQRDQSSKTSPDPTVLFVFCPMWQSDFQDCGSNDVNRHAHAIKREKYGSNYAGAFPSMRPTAVSNILYITGFFYPSDHEQGHFAKNLALLSTMTNNKSTQYCLFCSSSHVIQCYRPPVAQWIRLQITNRFHCHSKNCCRSYQYLRHSSPSVLRWQSWGLSSAQDSLTNGHRIMAFSRPWLYVTLFGR